MTRVNAGKRFEGAQCVHGHTTRYMKGGACIACMKAYGRARRERLKQQKSAPTPGESG